MGEDITYSGTASAAMEAVIHKIPAIAISQVCQNRCQDIQNGWEFELAKDTIVKLNHAKRHTNYTIILDSLLKDMI